jgi:outer membrane lipoprotein-sorting protein
MTFRCKFGFLFLALTLPGVLTAQSDDLLGRVWTGVQQSQAKLTTICGTMIETRTSKLIAKPMVLHGRFCSEGTDRFMLEYAEPNPVRIRVNGNYLNIIGNGKTEVLDIGGDIRHAQSSFGNKNSLEELEKDFDVTAQESGQAYELKLIPRATSYRHRLNYLVVKLSKHDFLPRSLEVDGKSGVNSVFTFEITSTNTKLPDSTFEVTKVK